VNASSTFAFRASKVSNLAPFPMIKVRLAIATVLLARSAGAAATDGETVTSPANPSAATQAIPSNLASDQLSVGLAPSSPSIPRTGFISDKLLGSNELSSSLALIYSAAVTRDLGAPPSAGSRFPDRGGTIIRLGAGTEWQASRHWALIPMMSGSPPSTTRTSTAIPFQDATGMPTNLAGDLQVKSSSVGGELSAEFDTLDAWGPELVVTSTGGLLNYWSTQRLLKLQLANDSVVTPAALAQQCQSQGCSPEVHSLLGKQSPSLLQAYLELDVTGIIRRTQLGVSGTAFVYSHDPAQFGFFGVAAFARGPSIGEGVPLAPLRFSVQGHVTQKVGRFRLAATAEAGDYVDSEGSTLSVSAKPSFDVTARARLWATGTWQRDRLSGLGTAEMFVAALGLRWAY
jgi:hypothetical protein